MIYINHPVFLAAGVRLFPALYSQVAGVPQVPAYLVCYAAMSAPSSSGSCWERQTLPFNRIVTFERGTEVSCCMFWHLVGTSVHGRL